MKKRGINRQDERQRSLLTESIAAAGTVAYIYGLVLLVVKLIITKDFRNVYIEFGLLIIMVITMAIHRMTNRNYDIPTTIRGKVLPVGSSKEERLKRITYYVKDTLIFSIVFSIFSFIWQGNRSFLFKFNNNYIGIFVEIVLTFILIFILNYLWYEYNVRKYNKYCESLENEN